AARRALRDRPGKRFHQGVHAEPPRLFAAALAGCGSRSQRIVTVGLVLALSILTLMLVTILAIMGMRTAGFGLPRLQILLDRWHAHLLRLDQALEMFARIDQALGANHALVVDHHSVRKLADAVGHPDVGREQIGEFLEMLHADETFVLGR